MASSSVEQREWPRRPKADQVALHHQLAQLTLNINSVRDFGNANKEHALFSMLVLRVDCGFSKRKPLPRRPRNRTEQVNTAPNSSKYINGNLEKCHCKQYAAY